MPARGGESMRLSSLEWPAEVSTPKAAFCVVLVGISSPVSELCGTWFRLERGRFGDGISISLAEPAFLRPLTARLEEDDWAVDAPSCLCFALLTSSSAESCASSPDASRDDG